MPNYTGFVHMVKRIALNAVENSKPAALLYGTVTKVSPIEITVDQKLVLGMAQLEFTKAVTDHWVDIEVAHTTENRGGGSGAAAYESHNHPYQGRKRIKVYNGLLKGEKVVLVRFQEGQRFLVLDRVSEHIVKGEWLG